MEDIKKPEYQQLGFDSLVGQTITQILGANEGSDVVEIMTKEGNHYKLYHEQGCCESVYLADVVGDPKMLIGEKVVVAEVASQKNYEEIEYLTPDYENDSFTWTFYKIRTNKEDLTLRWFGSSNGYYSEEVNCVMIY